MSGLLFRSIAWLLHLFPLPVLKLLARPLAALLWRISGRLRRVSLANVGLCYPDLCPQELEHRARQAMVHYARNALEVGVCWYGSRRRFDALFDPPVGRAELDEALAGEQGVLLMAPHFGAWELLGLALSDPLEATLYKPSSNPSIDAVLIERRERFGANLVPANRRGLKVIMDSLRAGGCAGDGSDGRPGGT